VYPLIYCRRGGQVKRDRIDLLTGADELAAALHLDRLDP